MPGLVCSGVQVLTTPDSRCRCQNQRSNTSLDKVGLARKESQACVNAIKTKMAARSLFGAKVSNLGARVLTPFVNGDHAWRAVACRDSLRAGARSV